MHTPRQTSVATALHRMAINRDVRLASGYGPIQYRVVVSPEQQDRIPHDSILNVPGTMGRPNTPHPSLEVRWRYPGADCESPLRLCMVSRVRPNLVSMPWQSLGCNSGALLRSMDDFGIMAVLALPPAQDPKTNAS